MAAQIPPPAEIDRTRAGILKISLPVFHGLLNLAKTLDVSGGWYDRETETFSLVIEGDAMPERGADGRAEPLSLLMRHLTSAAGEITVTAEWTHRPGERWLIRGPEPTS